LPGAIELASERGEGRSAFGSPLVLALAKALSDQRAAASKSPTSSSAQDSCASTLDRIAGASASAMVRA
jgi:hypothetical protein